MFDRELRGMKAAAGIYILRGLGVSDQFDGRLSFLHSSSGRNGPSNCLRSGSSLLLYGGTRSLPAANCRNPQWRWPVMSRTGTL